jgi:hypothetical protein
MYNLITPPDFYNKRQYGCPKCEQEVNQNDLTFNGIEDVCTECLEKHEVSECQVCGNPDYSDNMFSDENQEGFICKTCYNSSIRAVNQDFKSIYNLFNF